MRRIVPIYLAINTSPSMASKLPEIEHAIVAFADELLYSPILGDRVRVSLVAFADRARCLLRLTDLTERTELPTLVAGYETRFAPLFDLLATLTKEDAYAHTASGIAYSRPLVLLVTDGVPTDPGWEKAFNRFYRTAHPRITLITIGLEKAQAEEMGVIVRSPHTLMLGDAPDQPLVHQIKALLMKHVAPLVTSRQISRPQETQPTILPGEEW
ncbi:MAG TPA: VWA domain-containing protein [Nonomuraea sp.]|nr:VWA domain-containing protein [Nonomuraea sp.]